MQKNFPKSGEQVSPYFTIPPPPRKQSRLIPLFLCSALYPLSKMKILLFSGYSFTILDRTCVSFFFFFFKSKSEGSRRGDGQLMKLHTPPPSVRVNITFSSPFCTPTVAELRTVEKGALIRSQSPCMPEIVKKTSMLCSLAFQLNLRSKLQHVMHLECNFPVSPAMV